MNYLSVCSGIEAATVAWHDMGWTPVAFSEIEKFPSAVLAHHYPHVPNLGDMTKYKEWNLNGSIDILVGGTPCQSFSVAGLRKGLEDPRGNLMLTYCGILDKFRPKWFIWENVPGVLSSNGGRDFGSFLGAVAELGYGFAYRVLDAQYFGVAQRRRRVFVVGCLGDWQSAAEVLFESDCLRRDTTKGRKTGKEITTSFVPSLANCLQTTSNDYSRADGVNMICTENTGPLTARDYKGISSDDCNPTMMKLVAYETHPADSRIKEMGETCQTVTSRWGTGGGNVPLVQTIAFEPGIAKREGGDSRFVKEMSPTLRKEMGDNQVAVAYPIHPQALLYEGGGKTRNNDGKGNGLGIGNNQDPVNTLTTVDRHMVAYSLQGSMIGRDDKNGPQGDGINEEVCFTQNATNRHGVVHAFKVRGGCEGGGKGYLGQDEKAFTISTTQDQQIAVGVDTYNLTENLSTTQTLRGFGHIDHVGGVINNIAVRRLTPIECERLQGFPDGYTNIKPKGKDTPDGPRYKALGNSMAVPVMSWIGERINLINKAQEKI